MASPLPAKKTIELQANASVPRGSTIKLTVEYRIRPSATIDSTVTYEDSPTKYVDIDTDRSGDYQYENVYQYEPIPNRPSIEYVHTPTVNNVIDQSTTVIENLSEDDKSVSSEEAFFEEWSEEFRCRRTDEYDPTTNRLIRSKIIETSDHIKSDVIKEEYKEKNVRNKDNKTRKYITNIKSNEPINNQYTTYPRSSSNDRQHGSEEIYTTEIVYDSDLARNIQSSIQELETTENKRKQQREDVVSEEYHVEIEAENMRNGMSNERIIMSHDSNNNNQYDQYENSNYGKFLAQRVSVMPSNSQHHFKEIQVPLSKHSKTSSEQRKNDSHFPSRHNVKEVLVCVSGDTSPEKSSLYTPVNKTEHKNKRLIFIDSQTSNNLKHSTNDRILSGRVEELKNVFETTSTSNSNFKSDSSKYQVPITTGLTEQRRRLFEEQEQSNRESSRRPIYERRTNEIHTGPSSFGNNYETRSTYHTQSNDRFSGSDFDKVKSSIDSDLSKPLRPNQHSTPKASVRITIDDGEQESREPTPNIHSRDFSSSMSRYNDGDLEDILSHTPANKGKSVLFEYLPQKSRSPTKMKHDPNRTSLTLDSGVYEYSAATASHPLANSPSSWRQNVSTSYNDDTIRTHDNEIRNKTLSPSHTNYQSYDGDQTLIHNVDDSPLRSVNHLNTEIYQNESIDRYQPQRTVRRQLTTTKSDDYESLSNYRSQTNPQANISITTQMRTTKPLVVDQVETVETETNVECQIERTAEMKESTTTTSSPINSTKRTLTTSRSPYRATNETTPLKRVLLNEQPQYYEPSKSSSVDLNDYTRVEEACFKPIKQYYSQDSLTCSPISNSNIRMNNSTPRTIEVTSLSPSTHVTIGKSASNEIIAIVRVPELSPDRNQTSNAQIKSRYGASETNLYEKTKQTNERPKFNYEKVYASSYRPPLIDHSYQRSSRLRPGSFESTNHYSSPITTPTRSASYHSSLHERNSQQNATQPSTSQLTNHRYQTGSLSNLLGSSLDFEIEIEKRPPHQPHQPTSVSVDQSSPAIVSTSRDGRVLIKNVSARPGNVVVINSDFHSSDRSLNRSSGYFSSDGFRSPGINTNYSSDEQSAGTNQPPRSPSLNTRNYSNYNFPITSRHSDRREPYYFDRIHQVAHRYVHPANNSLGFNDTINQIDSIYNNYDEQNNNQRQHRFYKSPLSSSSTTTMNRRRQLAKNSADYAARYTSTGFQHVPQEQQTTSDTNNNNTSWSAHTKILQQNHYNGQGHIVQRNRLSTKYRNATKQRENFSDEGDENESPISDNEHSRKFTPTSSNTYKFSDNYS